MYHFEYVEKQIWVPVRKNIECILHEVQDLVRDKFTFSYRFIGSASRNMITCDFKSKKGFDFDVNVYINDEENRYTEKVQKEILMNALNRIAWKYGYSNCENNTRVITMKVKDGMNSRICYSFDIAIVHDYLGTRGEEKQEYIRYNKKSQEYRWVDQPKGFNLDKKICWLKNQGLWDEVREVYLYKKNTNMNPDKRSRSLFAETINEVCNQNGYIKKLKG